MPVHAAKTGKIASGRRTVSYRDAKGITSTALILGPGTNSGLKLQVGTPPAKRVVDDVALGTSREQTNVYFNRYP